MLGEKRPMDVKYVPTACYISRFPDKYYQYTVIKEHPRSDSYILIKNSPATLQ